MPIRIVPPAFAATVVPFLTTFEVDASARSLHPAMARLLDEFGGRDNLLSAVTANIHTFSWWGRGANYCALYEGPLSRLHDHPKSKVRRWAKTTLRRLRAVREDIRSDDDEREARWEI